MNNDFLPDTPLEDRHLAGIRQRVLTAVTQQQSPRRTPSRKAALSALTAGGLALALTGGAIAVIQATQEQIRHNVQCYEAASVKADFTSAATANELAGSAVREAIDPVTACGEMWRMGLVGRDVIPEDPNEADFTVPELVACTLRDGIGAGFPRGDSTASAEEFCLDLGLSAWTG